MSFTFFTQYLGNTRTVGAVAPSSRFLARKMLADVDFTKAKVIVEYGPGTGVFTKHITRQMSADCRLIVIETNPVFYKKLYNAYKSDERVTIVQESAEHAAAVLAEHHLKNPDYIISGLPFAALPPEVSRSILTATAALLGKKGVFITFQYTRFKLPLFRQYFSALTTRFELRNLPPAWVVTCRK